MQMMLSKKYFLSESFRQQKNQEAIKRKKIFISSWTTDMTSVSGCCSAPSNFALILLNPGILLTTTSNGVFFFFLETILNPLLAAIKTFVLSTGEKSAVGFVTEWFLRYWST